MKKILKIWILVLLLFSGISFISNHTGLPQVTYASMGSTGGGESSSGGGGSSGGGSSSSSSGPDSDTPNPLSLYVFLFAGGIYLLILLGDLVSYQRDYNKLAKHLYKDYDSLFLIKLGSVSYNHDSPADAGLKLFSPNLTIKEFESLLDRLQIKLSSDNIDTLNKSFIDTYIRAQYLYSQLLREKYVNKKYKLDSLKQYLDVSYYKTMVREIKFKVSQGTIDETVVDQAKISKYAKLDKNLILVKLDVRGQDKEIQFNKDFEDSFSRNKWSDYVIFGKNTDGQYKILALVYGEHFHLNGTDFNHQEGLNKDKYKEKKI